MTELELLEYRPELRPAVVELLEAVWGEHAPDEEFEWLFERSPAGRGLITLSMDDGRAAGMGAMTLFRMMDRGVDRLACVAIYMATHPDYRGRGIFQACELENERKAAERGSTLAIGFTNPSAGPIYVSRLGWHALFQPKLWARILRPRSLLRRRGGDQCLGPPGDDVRRYGPVRVERLRELGPEVDELCRSAQSPWPGAFVRDAALLRWRYVESPRDYRVFGAFRDDLLSGLVAVGHVNQLGLSVGVVADLLAPPGGGRAARALVARALREARGCDLVVGIPPPGHRRAFVSHGFVPTPRTLRVIAKPLADGVTLPEGGRGWFFALGDTDIF